MRIVYKLSYIWRVRMRKGISSSSCPSLCPSVYPPFCV